MLLFLVKFSTMGFQGISYLYHMLFDYDHESQTIQFIYLLVSCNIQVHTFDGHIFFKVYFMVLSDLLGCRTTKVPYEFDFSAHRQLLLV